MSEIIGYDSSNVLQKLEITSGKVGISVLPALVASSAAIGKLAANSGVNIGTVGIAALPALVASSAAIGKLAANSGVDIGDVDVTSLPALVAGSAKIGKIALLANEAADGSGTERSVLCDAGGRLQVDVINTVATTGGKSSTVAANISVDSLAVDAVSALADSPVIDISAARDIYIYGNSSDVAGNHKVQLWVASTTDGTYYGTSELGLYQDGYLGFKVTDIAAKFAKLRVTNLGGAAADFDIFTAKM